MQSRSATGIGSGVFNVTAWSECPRLARADCYVRRYLLPLAGAMVPICQFSSPLVRSMRWIGSA
jgi:hypothetical protein